MLRTSFHQDSTRELKGKPQLERFSQGMYVWWKGLYPEYIIQSYKSGRIRRDDTIKNQKQDWTELYKKRIFKWSMNIWRGAQYHYSLEKRIRTTMRDHHTSISLVTMKETEKCWWRWGATTFFTLLVEWNWHSCFEKMLGSTYYCWKYVHPMT